ncbi:MAG: hypothetical protein ACK5JR_16025 [Tropicimonas sp.]|uniref:hypothetical protein n=1 Tax=Tropicimonas sp. TaxID=2067044 RepID=UPI003A87328D
MTLNTETILFELDDASISGVTGGNGCTNCNSCDGQPVPRNRGNWQKPRVWNDDIAQRIRDWCRC